MPLNREHTQDSNQDRTLDAWLDARGKDAAMPDVRLAVLRRTREELEEPRLLRFFRRTGLVPSLWGAGGALAGFLFLMLFAPSSARPPTDAEQAVEMATLILFPEELTVLAEMPAGEARP